MEDIREETPQMPASNPATQDPAPSPLMVLAVLLGLILACALLASLLMGGLALALGLDTELLKGGLQADAAVSDRWAMRLLLAVNHFVTFFVAGALTVRLFYRQYNIGVDRADWRDYLGVRRLPSPTSLTQGVLLLLVSLPLVLFSYNLNQALPIPEHFKALEEAANEMLKGLMIMDTPWELFANLLLVALLPAVGEELVFRGLVQKQLHRLVANPWAVIVLSGAIFSLVHFQMEGFLPRWLLGVLLGWLYWRSGNLWVPALAHFFNNGFQVLGQYLYGKNLSTVDLEKNMDMPWYGALVSLLLVAAVMHWFEKPKETQSLTNIQ